MQLRPVAPAVADVAPAIAGVAADSIICAPPSAHPPQVDLTDSTRAPAAGVAPAVAGVASRRDHNPITKIIQLSREIRAPRKYIGYSAFLVFALLHKTKVYVWEGDNRVDLTKVFLPDWAYAELSDSLNVDAAVCTGEEQGDGSRKWVPISDKHPLCTCRHYVSLCYTGVCYVSEDTSTVDGFYGGLGAVVISTVADGDCGPDAMMHMLGENSTFIARTQLREAIADYILSRAKERWFQEVLAACQELTWDDVDEIHRLGEVFVSEAPAAQSSDAPAVAEGSEDEGPPARTYANDVSQELIDALKWMTSVTDESVLLTIAEELAEVERDEQVRAYRERDAEKKPNSSKSRALIHPSLMKSRAQVSLAYHEHLEALGWTPGTRKPYGHMKSFLSAWEWGSSSELSDIQKGHLIRQWHTRWRKQPDARAVAEARADPTAGGCNTSGRLGKSAARPWHKRRRALGGGRPRMCTWLGKELYEWWSGIRHSVDWKAIERGCPSFKSERKKVARFTQAMLKQKAKELISAYCTANIKVGKKVHVPKLTAKWWKQWRRDHGLSMRYPNRKYKVPLPLLEERLERGWLNIYRVRAAAYYLLGYDLEMENWDPSPFHHNETGSQNCKTLAVAGVVVPLIECHADTRKRWSANFTTFSDVTRINSGETPYVECMFRAEGGGEQVKPKLDAHLQQRGHPNWVSANVSRSGSYKTQDVLDFLSRHLPEKTASRRWRIQQADDFGAHLSPLVKKLCWSRGYVFIPHGGGVTPFVQTPDTDCIQHAKRKYLAIEGAQLLKQMRLGKCVPQLKPTDCIDIIVEVWSDRAIHLTAASGYVKTGAKAHLLDADLDGEIVREAGRIWRRLDMRSKVAAAVAEVKEEVDAGRLRWCYKDIMRQILPHPRKPEVDSVLDNIGDDGVDDNAGDAEGADHAGGEDAEGEHEVDAEQVGSEGSCDEDWGNEQDLEEWSRSGAARGADDSHASAVVGAGPGSPSLCDDVGAEAFQKASESHDLMGVYDRIAADLRAWGDISASLYMETQREKERKRARLLSKEDPNVLRALTQLSDLKAASERNHKLQIDEAIKRKLDLKELNCDIKRARHVLKDAQDKLVDVKSTLHAKQHLRKFSPEELGKGRKNCGGIAGKKNRLDVLQRMSRLGSGLSSPQALDFNWFCEKWDEAGVEDYGDTWPDTFSTWMQNVLDELDNAVPMAFSTFVYSETRRRLADAVALAVPAGK